MRMSIYVPDDLAGRVRSELGESNISAICQEALRDELQRQQAHQQAMAAGGFERIEIYVMKDDCVVAFQGREIARDYNRTSAVAYLTPKGAIAVDDQQNEHLYVYESYGEFISGWGRYHELASGVAEALGERYVKELDI